MLPKTKEWNLLLKSCRIAISPATTNISEEELVGIDWDQLYKMIRYHKVTPLCYKGLSTCHLLPHLPSSFQQKLKRHSFQFLTQNLKNAKELLRLIRLFREESIEIIPYKGIVLAEMAYQEIGLRESSDIDILIQQSDFKQTQTILLKEGYSPSFHLSRIANKFYFKLYCEYNFDIYKGATKTRSSRQFHVEPHWVLGAKMYQTFIGYSTIEKLTTKGELLGTPINKLSPDGLLITTATHHGGSDNWLNLKSIADVAAILQHFEQELDWERILETCDKTKITNILLLGLSLAKALFDSPLPAPLLKLISKKEVVALTEKRVKAFFYLTKRPLYAEYFIERILFQLKLREHWSTKFKVVFYHLVHALMRPILYWGRVEG